jgi:hypothetical protein
MEETRKGKSLKGGTPVERRREDRFPIRLEVAVALKGGVSLSAFATDISGIGMRIECVKALAPDTQMVVFVSLGQEIRFRGKVLWAQGVQTSDGSRYLMGVEVRAIMTDQEKAFDEQERRELLEHIIAQYGA